MHKKLNGSFWVRFSFANADFNRSTKTNQAKRIMRSFKIIIFRAFFYAASSCRVQEERIRASYDRAWRVRGVRPQRQRVSVIDPQTSCCKRALKTTAAFNHAATTCKCWAEEQPSHSLVCYFFLLKLKNIFKLVCVLNLWAVYRLRLENLSSSHWSYMKPQPPIFNSVCCFMMNVNGFINAKCVPVFYVIVSELE